MRYRPGTNDADVAADMPEYDELRIQSGDVVLDVGGHIGLFAERAYSLGADRVFSVEPDPSSAALHAENLAHHLQHVLLRVAVASGLTVTLHTHPDRPSSNSLVPRPLRAAGEVPIIVPAVDFQRLLSLAEPGVVKFDAEGAEYSVDWSLSPYVRAVAVEFHFLPDSTHGYEPYEDRSEDMFRVDETLLRQGFLRVYETVERRFWRTNVYRRRS